MKKKNRANGIMVLLILAIVGGGCGLAFRMKGDGNGDLGSAYEIAQIPDNALREEGEENHCSITIVCNTILDNLDSLEEEKRPYVPQSGVILPQTDVFVAEGDTVFEVLQRVCTAADIQLEYSWTPLHDSYYVEGINHLYEFDCGFESGWMYKVDDRFPNYGCSAYELQGGEQIVWCYTCVGLGEDVGESRMGEAG